LSGLSALRLGSVGAQLGELISEFSSDVTLGADSNSKVPTQHAVKYYVDNKFLTNLPSSLSAGTSPTTTVALRDSTNTVAATGANTDVINVTVAGVQVAQFTNTKHTYTPGGNTAFEVARYYMQLPSGDTATRPGTAQAGYIRFNSELAMFEGYSAGQWSGLGGGNPWLTKTANYTAVNNDRLFVDTTSNTVNITLPLSPAVGDNVRIVDVAGKFGTNNCTVLRNGRLIMTLAEDLTINTSWSTIVLTYSGSSYGWIIIEK
jgi:hypothetical protein